MCKKNIWHNSEEEQPDGKREVLTYDGIIATVDTYVKVTAPKWCYLDDVLAMDEKPITEPKFEIGDIVRFKDCEWPRLIRHREWVEPRFKTIQNGWWRYQFADGDSASECSIERFIDWKMVNKILNWLDDNMANYLNLDKYDDIDKTIFIDLQNYLRDKK